MKTKIKKLLFFAFLLSISNVSYPQSSNPRIIYTDTIGHCCPYLAKIELLTIDSSVNHYGIIVHASTATDGELFSKDLAINENNIDIQVCYWVNDATTAPSIIDTFLIEIDRNIEYNLNVRLYISYSDIECIKIDSNVIATKFSLDTFTSVKHIHKANKESIFPNPFNNYVVIRNYDFPIFVEIFDTYGQKLMESNVNEEILDLNYLKKGIYILKINDDYFKIMKQ